MGDTELRVGKDSELVVDEDGGELRVRVRPKRKSEGRDGGRRVLTDDEPHLSAGKEKLHG